MVLGRMGDWCSRFSNGCYIGLLPYSLCLLKKGRAIGWLDMNKEHTADMSAQYEQGTHMRAITIMVNH